MFSDKQSNETTPEQANRMRRRLAELTKKARKAKDDENDFGTVIN